MKIKKTISITAIALALLTACINDDEGTITPEPTPIERGDIEVNRFVISFRPKSGGPVKEFEYYDPDGAGGNAPVKNESWTLDYSPSGIRAYDASIKFFFNSLDVTDQIEAKGSNYIVCYRDMVNQNLRLNDSNLDANGLKLGTITTWQVLNDRGTSTGGNGNVRLTLNYIHLRKEGICDAGVRIFESTIFYQHQ